MFVSFLQHALTYEVQDATEINSLMRANTAITRMMTTYCRLGEREREREKKREREKEREREREREREKEMRDREEE